MVASMKSTFLAVASIMAISISGRRIASGNPRDSGARSDVHQSNWLGISPGGFTHAGEEPHRLENEAEVDAIGVANRREIELSIYSQDAVAKPSELFRLIRDESGNKVGWPARSQLSEGSAGREEGMQATARRRLPARSLITVRF